VGSLLIFIYFHQDFISGGVSLANLFELATEEECANHKPDAIVLFGNEDEKDETTFYHDKENDIWVGSVSYSQRIEYFGYLKKMSLTLHNLAKMSKGWLPIHGAMVNVYLRNGKKKGIVLIGDSGAGKSETIEALRGLGSKDIVKVDVVFDDMGSFHINNDQVYAQGTEIGAFVRLDDLDKGTAYRDMERSIFMNPESSNARVILPSAP
jgi:GTP-dependent phosphoenolpyruvate carboxykinase